MEQRNQKESNVGIVTKKTDFILWVSEPLELYEIAETFVHTAVTNGPILTGMSYNFRIMKILIIIAMTLSTFLVSLGCSDDGENIKLALDWYPNANHIGFYVAKEKGYYSDEGLKVTIYTPANPEDVLKTVGAGRDDLGISYQAEVLLARSQGIPVKSVAALVRHPLNSVMSLKSSGVNRPSDLVGKKVGITGIPFEEQLFATMVKYDDSSIEDVELINVGFDLSPSLMSGKVDAIVGAYWTHESILMEREGFDVTTLRMEDWGVPDFYELVLVASDRSVVDRSDTIRKFLKATKKGFEYANSYNESAVNILANAIPELNRDVELEGLKLLRDLWEEDWEPFGSQSKERWENLAKWMEQNNLLKKRDVANEAFVFTLEP